MQIRDKYLEQIVFNEFGSNVQFVIANTIINVYPSPLLKMRHYLKLQMAQAKIADNGLNYDVAIEYIASACNTSTPDLKALVARKECSELLKRAWVSHAVDQIRQAISEEPSLYLTQEKNQIKGYVQPGQAIESAISYLRDVLEEALPLLRRFYGLSREAALDLPTWEFDQLHGYAQKTRARKSLDMFTITGMAFGGKSDEVKNLLNSLKIAAGYEQPSATPKKVKLPTEEELKAIATRVNLMDRQRAHR